LDKKLKTCERNMQDLTNYIKRPNLKIMGIEEEEVQAKGIHFFFNFFSGRCLLESFVQL
jgi:hypothetical protein